MVFGNGVRDVRNPVIYHWERDLERKQRWRKPDHSAIYLLIAGTYTPFTLIACRALGAGRCSA
jgi:channel protein (hemolysin III family)